MVAFHKWNSKQKKIVPPTTGRFHTLVDFERKRAWIAALKWIVKTTDEHYYAFEDKFYVIEWIQKELNAKT